MRFILTPLSTFSLSLGIFAIIFAKAHEREPFNVLFIISDDLTYTTLSCYGNAACHTPNIDRLAETGTLFTKAYGKRTYCGPSRASFKSGYYPLAIGAMGYTNPCSEIGDRATWSPHFKSNGYCTAQVSKIFHMGVPGGIEESGHGAGTASVKGGNTFVVVEADGDDMVHSDGKTAARAVELIQQPHDEPFFI